LRTVLGGEGLALHAQHQRVARAGALRELLRLHPDPPVLAPGNIAGEIFVEAGIARADDLAEEALDAAEKVRLGCIWDVGSRKIAGVVDVEDDDLEVLLALKGVLLIVRSRSATSIF
jgi:hypothetical protein